MKEDTVAARVILLRADAPAMPAPGAACTGCGVCCAAEPCPLGMIVSRRRQGRCRALWWEPEPGRYRCALVSRPERVLRGLPALMAPWMSALARRWIASSSGCDAWLETRHRRH